MAWSKAENFPVAGGGRITGASRSVRQERAPVPIGFDARLAAAIIDAVWLVTMAVLLCPLIDRFKAGAVPAIPGVPGADDGDVNGLMALALWLAYSATEVLTAATLGKRLLDVRVARADGWPSTLGRRAVRWLVKGSPMLLFALAWAARPACRHFPAVPADLADRLPDWLYGAAAVAAAAVGVGGLWALLPSGRAMHDRIAGTAVYCYADVIGADIRGHGFAPLFRAMSLTGRPTGNPPAGRTPPLPPDSP